jgi:hypothetical protein
MGENPAMSDPDLNHEDDSGQLIVPTEHFPTPDSRLQRVPAALRPDTDYPFGLITCR